jgi:hypothetical protein
MQQVLVELRRLARRRQDDGFGLPRIIGYIVQLAALGIVGAAALSNEWGQAATLLVAAVFAQLLALTMFVLSARER